MMGVSMCLAAAVFQDSRGTETNVRRTNSYMLECAVSKLRGALSHDARTPGRKNAIRVVSLRVNCIVPPLAQLAAALLSYAT